MNPSTADLLRAAQSIDADEVILLPNNSNIILAAEHAAAHADRKVEVVHADSIPGGLAAMVAYNGTRTAAENAAEMRKALDAIATGEVTIASRDVELNGIAIRKGQWLGLADGEPVAVGESFEEVASVVVETLLDDSRSLLTLLTGEDEAPLEGLLERIRTSHPDVEVELQEGGQPHYHLLLSAE
jgi:dihydroxyacetone kinase-like predicted kinase